MCTGPFQSNEVNASSLKTPGIKLPARVGPLSLASLGQPLFCTLWVKHLTETVQVNTMPDQEAVSGGNVQNSVKRKSKATRAGLEELTTSSTTSAQLNQHLMAVAMEVSFLTSSQILETLITEESH